MVRGMSTLDELSKLRCKLGELVIQREALVVQALGEHIAQHQIAVAAGMGVRTVGDIARSNSVGRPRGRPRLRREHDEG